MVTMQATLLLVVLACFLMFAAQPSEDLGVFEGQTAVGQALPGKATYADGVYTVTGAGENMWFATDAFQYVWKDVSGDVSLEADVTFVGVGKNAHRKACLVIRQNLDADSAYADIALHGDGLTSLQYRDAKGRNTREIQANVTGPRRLRIEKRGDYVSIFIAEEGQEFRPAGGSIRLLLSGSFKIGLGVCSHEKDVLETAIFKNVKIAKLDPLDRAKARLFSTLETVTIASTDRRVVRVAPEHFEAPNWSPDGKWLVYNGGGLLYKIAPTGGAPTKIDTGFATRCNNDHGISPDGSQIVISDQSQDNHQSTIYTLPFAGGTPKKITDKTPSYWHGWSPDGKTLAYCAQRDGKFGIFTIPVEGGEETRLTTATGGLDDGPDYSPDGKHIYFNSDRTGKMQVWRMKNDGSELEQVTKDEFNNWFPHVSPDGKWMVFLSYGPEVAGHPADKDVQLRLMSLADRKITFLAKLFGGQGTINVPSWSPDSTRVAFVSYQYLP